MWDAYLSMLVQVWSSLFKDMLIFNIHTQMKIIFLLLLCYTLSCICYFKVLADKLYFLLQLQKQGTGKYYIMDFTICTLHLLLLLFLLLPGAELPSWKFWLSQRLISIFFDPGRRLSSFWSSFGRCPVWCYPPICTWVFLVIFWLEVSN